MEAVADSRLFEGMPQRESVRKEIEKRYPLRSHSGGCGCGGWDLGFYLEGQADDDPRSLELTGHEGGYIKSRIVENYRRGSRAEGEPRRELIFGHERPEDGETLPASAVRAIEHMIGA